MKPYCTIGEMKAQYGQATLVAATNKSGQRATDINMDRLQAAMEDASHEIDLYLHGRVALPLTLVPAVIRRTACTLAFAYLHMESGEDHPAHLRAKEARATLKEIAKGTLSIGLAADGQTPPLASGIAFSAGRNDWSGNW